MASRVSEAQRVERRLRAAMTARPRDDVAYADVGDHATALMWLTGRLAARTAPRTRPLRRRTSLL